MGGSLDRVDGMEGIWSDQDNVTSLAIKILIIDMELGCAFTYINNFDIGMPVK